MAQVRLYNIVFFVDPPNITCSHKTCFESRSVELIAKIYLYDTCHAIQEVFWTVNDEKIDKQGLGGKFSKVSVNFPCLTIHNVNRCDAGSYKLSATNALGMTVSDAIELSIPFIYSTNLSKYIDQKNINRCLFTCKTYQAYIIQQQKNPFSAYKLKEKYFNRYS